MFIRILMVVALVPIINACIGQGGGCCSAPQCAPQIPRCSYSASSYGASYAQAPSYVSTNLGSSYSQPAPTYLNAPVAAPSPTEYVAKG